jgi:predicted nucleic acid-binding protein
VIAIDTNVLVRVLLGDEPKEQVDAARALLRRAEDGEKIFLSAFVLLETAWVLKSKGRSPKDIADALTQVVQTEGIVVSLKAAVLEGLACLRTSPAGMGLADAFILADAAHHEALPLMTFDEALQRSEPTRAQPLR